MPPASKRKRGGKLGPKSKRGKKVTSKKTFDDVPEEDQEVDESDDNPDEWQVEEVVDKRILSSGQIQYCLKWKNWPSSSNTWEPVEHLNCPELVEAFEAKQRTDVSDADDDPPSNGFDDGLTVKAISGAAKLKINGQEVLHYLVEWEEEPGVLMPVLAQIVREKVPQILLAYLTDKIKWTNKRTIKVREMKMIEDELGIDNATFTGSDDIKIEDDQEELKDEVQVENHNYSDNSGSKEESNATAAEEEMGQVFNDSVI